MGLGTHRIKSVIALTTSEQAESQHHIGDRHQNDDQCPKIQTGPPWALPFARAMLPHRARPVHGVADRGPCQGRPRLPLMSGPRAPQPERMPMRSFLIAAVLCALAPVAAAAGDYCLDTLGVLEKVQKGGILATKLDESQVEKLRAAFAEAHPGQKMAAGDQGLAFHRDDAPGIDWLILFQKGCASSELPIDSKLVGDVMTGDYIDPFQNPSALAPEKTP